MAQLSYAMPETRKIARALLALLIAATAAGCGAGPPLLRPHSSTPDAVRALGGGDVDAVMGDYPAVAYAARESVGQLEVAGEQFEVQEFAIAVNQEAEPLRLSLLAGLRQIIMDGTYARILGVWALEQGAIQLPSEEAMPSGVPPQLADGTLRIGMEIAYPPMEFRTQAEGEQGVDVELARAIGAALRVQVEFVDLPFDQLLTQVESGEIDVAMSSITVTRGRASRVSFVPYYRTGSGILVPRGNPNNIRGPRDLCGRRIGVQEGTVHVRMLESLGC